MTIEPLYRFALAANEVQTRHSNDMGRRWVNRGNRARSHRHRLTRWYPKPGGVYYEFRHCVTCPAEQQQYQKDWNRTQQTCKHPHWEPWDHLEQRHFDVRWCPDCGKAQAQACTSPGAHHLAD